MMSSCASCTRPPKRQSEDHERLRRERAPPLVTVTAAPTETQWGYGPEPGVPLTKRAKRQHRAKKAGYSFRLFTDDPDEARAERKQKTRSVIKR